MTLSNLIMNVRSVVRAPRWSAEKRRLWQTRKLQALVHHAYREVPYYQQLMKRAGVRPEHITTVDDLSRIPVSTRHDLQAVDPDSLLSRRVNAADLQKDSSSGSTGSAFTVYYDPHYVQNRNLRFLRGLWSAGYRPGQRLLLVTDREDSRGKPWMRWSAFSPGGAPDSLLAALNDLKPQTVYGFGAGLRQMAEGLSGGSGQRHHPQRVIWTAETLDGVTRRQIEGAFHCPVYDFYGLTEMGLVAWECQARSGYHLAEDSLITEALAAEPGGNLKRLVLTNLDLYCMPLIRYDSGDLVGKLLAEPCTCGSRLTRIGRVEGRQVDRVRLPDGEWLSPYAFIGCLEVLDAIRRFQVIQDDYTQIRLMVQTDEKEWAHLQAHLAGLMKDIVKDQLVVSIEQVSSFPERPNQKFRAVQSMIGRAED